MWIVKIFFLFVLASCTLEQEFLAIGDVPSKPKLGYNRLELFPKYLVNTSRFSNSPFFIKTATRTNWNKTESDFRKLYPDFRVGLLSFNNFSYPNLFTWQERLIFSDAMELVILVVNHPRFAQEMSKITFYNNDRSAIIPSSIVVQEIKNAEFSIVIGKESLEKGILAKATVGGFNKSIIFRNDVDYQKHELVMLAIILAHEITHNMGYLHSSNVPYGIQNPFFNTIQLLSVQDMDQFHANTPFLEQEFLTRVRVNSFAYMKNDEDIFFQEDREHDFSEHTY